MSAIRAFTGQVSHVQEIGAVAGEPARLTARFTPLDRGGHCLTLSTTLTNAPEIVALFQDFAEVRFIGDQTGPNSVTPLAEIGVPLRDPLLASLAAIVQRLRAGEAVRIEEPMPGTFNLREIYRIVHETMPATLTDGPTLTRSVEVTYPEGPRIATVPAPARFGLNTFAAHIARWVVHPIAPELAFDDPEPWLANLMVLDQRQELARRPTAGSQFSLPYRIVLVSGEPRSQLRTSVPSSYEMEEAFDTIALHDLMMQDLPVTKTWTSVLRRAPASEPLTQPVL